MQEAVSRNSEFPLGAPLTRLTKKSPAIVERNLAQEARGRAVGIARWILQILHDPKVPYTLGIMVFLVYSCRIFNTNSCDYNVGVSGLPKDFMTLGLRV